jgi:hypothetical protein
MQIGLRNRVAFEKYLGPVANTEWVLYAKPPFGGPKQVLEYLGRYTHGWLSPTTAYSTLAMEM